jgi:single-strand DNA-binding protein
MTDTITLTGLVATQPRAITTSEGLFITSFRLASTQRRFDRSKERWVDGETNWYTITAFRQLATNVASSIQKGDRVVATGKLRIRDWAAGDKVGTNIEVDAEAIGHDLLWGTAVFTRSIATALAERVAADQLASGELSDASATGSPVDSHEWATSDGTPPSSDDGTAAALDEELDAAADPLTPAGSVPVPF